MSVIAKGRIAQLFFFAVLSGLVALSLYLAKKGKVPEIRKLPALDMIDELIGRATEMGRPLVYLTAGLLENVEVPQTIASFTILDDVARKCARMNTDLRTVARFSTHIPIVTDVLETAYLAEGRREMFKPERIVYFAEDQWAYCSGVISQIIREKPASMIFMGAWWGELLVMLENAAINGVMSVGGSANTHQIPFIVLCTNGCLIGEELLAAQAYISKDPVSIGTVSGGDLGRYFILATIIVGTLLATGGVFQLVNLLRL